MNLPPQLQNHEFRFLRVKERSKKPIDDWKDKENHYHYDDAKLVKHLEAGGNIGVLGGYGGLVVIDCDSQELVDRVQDSLPRTLVEFTANGCHFFYICNGIDMFKSIDLGETHYGEIRADTVHQTVISPSVHESGKVYRIGADVPIAEISLELLMQAISPYTEERKIEWDKQTDEKVNLAIEQVLDVSQFKRLTNGELQGKHPFHDSKTGVNFCINLEKQIWHCFRHGCGGNAMHLLAMQEGLLKCGEKIDTPTFMKLAQICKDKFSLNIIIENFNREIDTVQDLMNKPMPEIEYYVDPVLPKAALILIGGKPSSFKSMLSLDMCLNVSSGNKYLNEFQTRKNTRILLYDLENGRRLLARRLRYLINGSEGLQTSNFYICYNFNKRNMAQELAFAEKYDIIILDSYRRFLKGEENSSEITDLFYHEFLKPLRDIGKTIIILHHFRKARPEDLTDEDLQDLFRGSSDIPAQFDMVYGLIKTQENHEGKLINFKVSFIPSKNRLGLNVQSFVLGVTKDDSLQKTTITFNKFGYVSQDEEFEELLFNLLKGRSIKRQALITMIKDKMRLSSATIDRRLKELLAANMIFKGEYGTYELPAPELDKVDASVIKKAERQSDKVIKSDSEIITLSDYQSEQLTQLYHNTIVLEEGNCAGCEKKQLLTKARVRQGKRLLYCQPCADILNLK